MKHLVTLAAVALGAVFIASPALAAPPVPVPAVGIGVLALAGLGLGYQLLKRRLDR